MIHLKLIKQLSHFTLDVETVFAAGISVLAGTSGSGKSTLLKMITGFVNPDDGQIRVGEHDLYDRSKSINVFPERRRIGYVPQNYLLFPHLTVFENVAFGPKAMKFPKSQLTARVHEVLEMCGILHHANRLPAELSGGEQQRVALARAIVTQPALLLLDEPFSALDVRTRRVIRTEVREILQAARIPTILVTHDPTDALAVGDEIFIMEQGALIQKGSFAALREHPRSRFVAEFTGLNAFHGTAVQTEAGLLTVTLENGMQIVAAGHTEGPVLLLIEQTAITLAKDAATNSARNCLQMRVTEMIEEAAGQWKLMMRGGIDLSALITSDALRQYHFAIGDTLYAAIKATAVRVEAL